MRNKNASQETCTCPHLVVRVFTWISVFLWLLIIFISHREVTKLQIAENFIHYEYKWFPWAFRDNHIEGWGESHQGHITLNLTYYNCFLTGSISYWLWNYRVLLVTGDFWAHWEDHKHRHQQMSGMRVHVVDLGWEATGVSSRTSREVCGRLTARAWLSLSCMARNLMARNSFCGPEFLRILFLQGQEIQSPGKKELFFGLCDMDTSTVPNSYP